MGETTEDISFGYALIGVFLTIAATFCAALANILIKWMHEKDKKLPEDQVPKAYFRPLWWFVILLYIGDGFLSFSAFSFAPLSLVAPISSLTIGINGALAYWFFGEKMSRRDYQGAGLAIVGSIIAISFGSRQSPNHTLDELLALYGRPAFVVFAIISCVALVGSVVVILRTKPEKSAAENAARPSVPAVDRDLPSGLNSPSLDNQVPPSRKAFLQRLRAVSYAFLASGVGAWTNLLGKSAAELIRVSIIGENQMKYATTWVFIFLILVLGFLQLKCMSLMMANFEAVLIIPIYQCMFILSLILYGSCYFGEFSSMEPVNLIFFFISIIICFYGIHLLSQRAGAKTRPHAKSIEILAHQAASQGVELAQVSPVGRADEVGAQLDDVAVDPEAVPVSRNLLGSNGAKPQESDAL